MLSLPCLCSLGATPCVIDCCWSCIRSHKCPQEIHVIQSSRQGMAAWKGVNRLTIFQARPLSRFPTQVRHYSRIGTFGDIFAEERKVIQFRSPRENTSFWEVDSLESFAELPWPIFPDGMKLTGTAVCCLDSADAFSHCVDNEHKYYIKQLLCKMGTHKTILMLHEGGHVHVWIKSTFQFSERLGYNLL